MLKVIAAFLAPFTLCLFFFLYNLVTMNIPGTFALDGFLFVYIYALPAYLLIAVPASIVIERINKGIRWVNYALAGAIGGAIVIFLNTVNRTLDFVYSIELILFYMLAGFTFYATLKILEIVDQRLAKSAR